MDRLLRRPMLTNAQPKLENRNSRIFAGCGFSAQDFRQKRCSLSIDHRVSIRLTSTRKSAAMKTSTCNWVTLVIAATALSACCCKQKTDTGKDAGPVGNPPALCLLNDDTGNPIPADFAGTTGATSRSHAANHVNQVLKVEHACCQGFDRLIFTMDGIHEPTYTIEYAAAPFSDCGSGNTHNVAGQAFLKIKMTPAEGHGNGQATLPRDTSYSCPNLKHLSIICDFESDLTFVIGLNAKKPYRVLELQNPNT